MRSRADGKESAGHASGPFFGAQSARAAFISHAPVSIARKEQAEPREEAEATPKPLARAKLVMGEPNDPFEREADAMADRVVQRKSASGVDRGVPPTLQRKCAACETETSVDDPVQAKARDAPSSESPPLGLKRGLAQTSGSGAPLERHTREQMEDAFHADFSAVRVHDGAASAAMNERVGARAFTHGADIYFNAGEFTPGTERGKHLLAHELTHVVQQRRAMTQGGNAKAIQQKPKRTAEERDAILAKAAQSAFESYEEHVDAQLDAEALLGLDSKKNKDKPYAWRLGQRDKAQVQNSGALTIRIQHEITVKIRFFSGDAKSAYIQTIAGALSEAADGEQVTEILAEPRVAGASEQEEAEGLGCDAGKKQFPMLYEGEPEKSTCMDITTDKDFAANYFDNNIDRVVSYAIPGTTWENVEYSSFNALMVTYRNGRSEYFLLDTVGNFYYGGKVLSLREFFYYKRRGTGLIYPVNNGRLYSSELLTPNLISYKNGLTYIVKDLQGLFDLVQATAAFASIIASYSVVEGFRVSLQGFRIPRGAGKTGGGKGGGSQGSEPGGVGSNKTGGQPQGSGNPQKVLNSSQQKGTGRLTSDPVHPGMVRRGEAKANQTMYEYKQTSTNPDDQAEARMAARLAAEGYDVHFRANDKGGDLVVGGTPTDVKHSRGGNIATQMSSAAQQGADQVIIDGSTAKLTSAQARAGIDKYETMAGQMVAGESRPRHPKLRDLKTVFIVLGDGTMVIYHRDTSLKKAH